jgi:hypothetical protein
LFHDLEGSGKFLKVKTYFKLSGVIGDEKNDGENENVRPELVWKCSFDSLKLIESLLEAFGCVIFPASTIDKNHHQDTDGKHDPRKDVKEFE